MTDSAPWLASKWSRPDDADALGSLLSLGHGGQVGDVLALNFSRPITDLTRRPSKRFRGRLVEVGFDLVGPQTLEARKHCSALGEAIELLHAGSLAIDDLQDGSKMRRGQPALHVKYGMPLSITIGNALYFWPLEMIAALKLPSVQELLLYRIYHRALLRAHVGQAIDVGVPIDALPQERIYETSMASMELKSGALFSLGLLMGAVLAGAPDEILMAIDHFGHGFGMGLQMFDDLGNLRSHVDPGKRREDILLRRPTWVWACAARYYSKDLFSQFVSAAHQLPNDAAPLETWFELHDFQRKGKQLAQQHLDSCLKKLELSLAAYQVDRDPIAILRRMASEIAAAYE